MPNSDDKAKHDDNRVPTLTGVSSSTTTIAGKNFVEDETPVPIAINPITGAIILEPT